MHTIVLGSGVVGTTTAWYLAKAGVKVTVLERQAGPALETSFANAGQISPGYATPWAAPGIPMKALKWLFQKHAPLAIRPDGSLYQWEWLAQMLLQCTAAHYDENKERMLRLSEYSRDCLRALRQDADVHYEERSLGTLQLFRTEKQLEAAARDVAVLKACGVPHELLDRKALAGAEPALAAAGDKLTGGLRLPNDETGDCFLFTNRLADKARALGVDFKLGVDIQSLVVEGGHIRGVRTNEGVLQADRYVLALGSYSRAMLAPLGLKVPVYPLKGYSLTIPVRDAAKAPVSTILDETYKIAVTRFDQRIRVGGMAEVSGFDLNLRPARRATLEMVVEDLFPGAGDTPAAEFWTGLRPATPDGTPIIGATAWPELYLNTGHGTLGWTMSCGSGALLADLITGRQPAIRHDDLAVSRYQRGAATPSKPLHLNHA